jgi:hypothetical protein
MLITCGSQDYHYTWSIIEIIRIFLVRNNNIADKIMYICYINSEITVYMA